MVNSPVKEGDLTRCRSCRTTRGTRTRGWVPITKHGAVTGYTCPTCPEATEPIRLESSGRLVAVVNTTPAGALKRMQAKRRFDTLDEARAWVQEVRDGVDRAEGSTYVDPTRFTVREICTRWVARRRQEVGTPGGIRESTVNDYESALHSLLLKIGDHVARKLTTDDVEEALRSLATEGGKRNHPLSHRSLVYALGALRQALDYATRQRWLAENVARHARAPRRHGNDGDDRRARRWTTTELVTFRREADESRHAAERGAWVQAGMRLSLCGMRRSEVLGLDWTNVDLQAGTIRVEASRTKTGRGSATTLGDTKTANSRRTVAAEVIHPGTKSALKALWLQQGCPTEGLVVVDAINRPVHPDLFSRTFAALCTSADVPHPGSIHNIRHTLATALKEAGVPDNQAAALLGHDVATYLRFYVLADNDAAAEAAQVAGRLFNVV